MEYYFVVKTTGVFVGQLTLEEINRKFRSGEISGEYVVTKSTGPSYHQVIKTGTANWIRVADLFAGVASPTTQVSVTEATKQRLFERDLVLSASNTGDKGKDRSIAKDDKAEGFVRSSSTPVKWLISIALWSAAVALTYYAKTADIGESVANVFIVMIQASFGIASYFSGAAMKKFSQYSGNLFMSVGLFLLALAMITAMIGTCR